MAEEGESCEPSVCDCAPGFWLNVFAECVGGNQCGLDRSGGSITNGPFPQNEERVSSGCDETFNYAEAGKCSGVSTRYRYGADYNHNCVCKEIFSCEAVANRIIVYWRKTAIVRAFAPIRAEMVDCNKRSCYNKYPIYIYTFAPCEEAGLWDTTAISDIGEMVTVNVFWKKIVGRLNSTYSKIMQRNYVH